MKSRMCLTPASPPMRSKRFNKDVTGCVVSLIISELDASMHVQIKSERPDCYNAGGYVFPPPQSRPQLQTPSFLPPQQAYLANHPVNSQPATIPSVTGPQPAPVNKDTSKFSEDQVDFSSIKGIFGWTLIDDIHVPCIFRHEKKYVSVRIVEHKLLSKYPNSYPDELGKHAPLTSFFITVNESKLLNEINTVHCDGEFGQKQFTTKDLIVLLTDFEVFYGLVKKTFPENKVQNANEVQPKPDNNENLSLTILSKYCGWFQINNTVSPYIRRADDKYIPLSVIRYAAGLLVDIPVTGVLLSVAECDLLNKTCKAAGFDFCFSKTTRVIALFEVTRHCSVHIRDLPFESPLTHAQYMDLPSPVPEQRPTPPPGQSRPTPPPGQCRPTPPPGYPNQGNMGIPLQNMPPQMNSTMMQMHGKQNDKLLNYEGFQQRPNMPLNPAVYNPRMFVYNRPPWMHNSTVSPPNVSLNPQSNMPLPNMSGAVTMNGQFQSQTINSHMNRPNVPLNNQKNSMQRNTPVNNVPNSNQNGWHGQHPYQNPISRLDTYMMNHPVNKQLLTNQDQVNKHAPNVNSNIQIPVSIAGSHNRQPSNASNRMPAMSNSQQMMMASQALSAAAGLHVVAASRPGHQASDLRSPVQHNHNVSVPVSSNTQSSVANLPNSNSSVIQKTVKSVQQLNPVLSRNTTNISPTNDTSDQLSPVLRIPSPAQQNMKQVNSDSKLNASTIVSDNQPVISDSSSAKMSDGESNTNKHQTPKHSVVVQQLKDAISGVWLGGKSISCLCLSLPNRKGKFCLVEAVCKLYFSGCSVEEFQYALASVLNIPLVTCTEDEEKAFIFYYSLPVKELKCNKMIGFEELKSFFPQLNYMFKDKKSIDAQDKNMSDTDQAGTNELYIELGKPDEEKPNSQKTGIKRPCSEAAENSPPAKQPNRTLEETVQKLKNQQTPNTDTQSTETVPTTNDDVIVLD
ncbi:hypothetical protein ScPMuIL_018632 [Solemya velum]